MVLEAPNQQNILEKNIIYPDLILVPLVGFNKNKLPMGMQIIGKKNDDLKVLAFAKKYEQMFNYSTLSG